mmetsp:Transcript_54503/g.137594  ORF Transcript_54503/g.137594 Transcript_54503/m.137594 type:complete len:548 (+) Transcript_54503:66-1709(+)|eukprot:CAMPEP_0115186926 /NCGR_PEP_ID=MMETSP0270-20121206/10229_1 /TAXON_ID=71861 /ORGANISM="Scrippsiella trochoidea, Strain CCMP3099" /LENGTH=547 /DNA_ID=CAMNT_0002600057 /DNA_START=32 /DNA_END=1675 /DNA_ORIENTATION=-
MTAALRLGLSLVLLCSPGGGLTWAIATSNSAIVGGATFVQLFEWSWPDVAKECEEWLGPKGFKAVQVSPAVEHREGSQWWTRYQPVTYNIISRSGNETQFRDMVERCRSANVDVYVDVVLNGLAFGAGRGVGGTHYGSPPRTFAMFGPADFHHAEGDPTTNCASAESAADRSNKFRCDLFGQPDLCLSCSLVQQTLVAYLEKLKDFGVAGFRLSAADFMDPTELRAITSAVEGVSTIAEVFTRGSTLVQPEEYASGSSEKVIEPRFAVFIQEMLTGKRDLRQVLEVSERNPDFVADAHAVVFMDNHDTQRRGVMDWGAGITHERDASLYDVANILMLSAEYGYPRVMSSFAMNGDTDAGPPSSPVHMQGDLDCGYGSPWVCEHRRPSIANMVRWRAVAADASEHRLITVGYSGLVWCRGAKACIAVNTGSSSWLTHAALDLPPGRYCNVIQSDDSSICPFVDIAPGSQVVLEVPAKSAVAYHVGATRQSQHEREGEGVYERKGVHHDTTGHGQQADETVSAATGSTVAPASLLAPLAFALALGVLMG